MNLAVQRRTPPIDWTGVPAQLKGRCSAVCHSLQECLDLVNWFGDAEFCPYLPVLLLVPGAQTAPAINGLGIAPAAEIRDIAVAYWEQTEEDVRLKRSFVDFDEAREKRGLMRREDVDAAVRQAMRDRVARHKANPITDPARQPIYPNPTGRIVFGQHPGVPYQKE